MAKKTKVPTPVSADMRIEVWPIDRPVDYPKNARKWSAQAIAKVASSIREYGWRQPIVVDGEGVIVIGHLRRTAGKSIGLAECPVHVASDLTAAQIRGLRLADNRTSQEATWDFGLLATELVELKASDFDLKFTAFNSDELITMFAAEGWESPKKGRKGRSGEAQLDGLEYRVVVDCADELQQTELLDRFTAEGLKARPLIS